MEPRAWDRTQVQTPFPDRLPCESWAPSVSTGAESGRADPDAEPQKSREIVQFEVIGCLINDLGDLFYDPIRDSVAFASFHMRHHIHSLHTRPKS